MLCNTAKKCVFVEQIKKTFANVVEETGYWQGRILERQASERKEDLGALAGWGHVDPFTDQGGRSYKTGRQLVCPTFLFIFFKYSFVNDLAGLVMGVYKNERWRLGKAPLRSVSSSELLSSLQSDQQ